MRPTTFKHHRAMSFLFSANDTWKTGHKKLKAQLRTGTVAEFSDARVLRAAEAAYALERIQIKLAYPKCTIPKKLPEKVAQMVSPAAVPSRHRWRQLPTVRGIQVVRIEHVQ